MITIPVLNHHSHYKLDPRIIIGIGLNYRDHIAEHDKIHVQGFNETIPQEPVLFSKTPNTLIAHEDAIQLPPCPEGESPPPRIDHEAELAFIIKDRCRHISRHDAFKHILGYTCMNDVSHRPIQRRDKSGWFRGKSLDTFGPIGPVIALTEDIKDPNNLDICCRLNGRTVQSANTRQMIFPVPVLLEYITRQITLGPGDVVTTGTPAGVGPITAGDVVEIEISGIGILRNPVIAALPA